MSSNTASQTDPRFAQVLIAQIKQQFDAPVSTIIDGTELLLEDAASQGNDDAVHDLRRILTAAHQLRQLIAGLHDLNEDARETGVNWESLQRKLRHDLRTPLNAVKGYGEMLRDDAADDGRDAMVAELDRILESADGLLAQIDRIVQASQPDAIDDQEAERANALAKSLIDTLKPMGDAHRLRDIEPASILVVDDNADNRAVLSRRIKREGHRVSQAESGLKALAMLEREMFDLILLDLLMPDLNGFEVLSRLKRDQRFAEIPVIVISALTETASVVRCIEAGAEDYLTKPFDPVLLRARVGSTLEKKRLREKAQQVLARELELATAVQRSLFPPPAPPESPIHGMNRPAGHVSGDFFDFFTRSDGRLAFALGDVSGKGLSAALLMAGLASLFRHLAKSMDDPSEILGILNREFQETVSYGRFVTAVVGLYDQQTGHLLFANAGHLAPLHIRPGHEHQTFPAQSPPIGILPDMTFANEELTLDGGAFYLFTDGLLECRPPAVPGHPDGSPEQELGPDGVERLISQYADLPVHERLAAMVDTLDRDGYLFRDDLTILVISGAPSPEAPPSA